MKTNKLRFVLMVMVLVVSISACKPAAMPINAPLLAAPKQADTKLPQNVDVKQAQELWSSEIAVVIDVREPSEYDEGHIPGATLIPLGSLPNRLDEITVDRPVIIVCRSGNRSNQAATYLRDQGFDNVHNMLGGMTMWVQAGYEIER